MREITLTIFRFLFLSALQVFSRGISQRTSQRITLTSSRKAGTVYSDYTTSRPISQLTSSVQSVSESTAVGYHGKRPTVDLPYGGTEQVWHYYSVRRWNSAVII